MSKSASRIWQKSMQRPLAGSTNQAAGRRYEVGRVLQPQLCISTTFAFMDFSPSSLWVSRTLPWDTSSQFRTDPFHPGRRAFCDAHDGTIAFGVGTPERIAAEGKIGPGGTAEVWVFHESLVFRVEGKKVTPHLIILDELLQLRYAVQSSHDLRR